MQPAEKHQPGLTMHLHSMMMMMSHNFFFRLLEDLFFSNIKEMYPNELNINIHSLLNNHPTFQLQVHIVVAGLDPHIRQPLELV